MEDTFTTEVTETKGGVDIMTLHDQTGSAAIGFIPTENILSTIEKLRNFIGFNLPVNGQVCPICNESQLINSVDIKYDCGNCQHKW